MTKAMALIRYILVWLTLLVSITTLFSCKTDENKLLIDGLKIDNIPLGSNLDTSNLFANIVNEIAQENDVRWTESFTGKKSLQWIRYEWLSKNASDKQLMELMNGKNANLRAYAFLSLKDRPNIDLKSIVLDHLKDTSYFTESWGCLGNTKIINEFCFEQCTGHFSKAELKKYRQLISECNSRLSIFNSK